MSTDQIIDIIKWVVTAVGIVSSIVTGVIAWFKAKKEQNAEKVAQEEAKLKDLFSKIPGMIKEAEETFTYSADAKMGKSKKAYVKQQIKMYTLENGIKVDEAKIDEQIEAVLSAPQKKDTTTSVTA